jgi:4-hydroxybenzoate polyprenyltransferase
LPLLFLGSKITPTTTRRNSRSHDKKNHLGGDIKVNDWINRYALSPARPYLRLARLDRPIGIWLLLLPCWWGLALAGGGVVETQLFALFALGAVIMRAAGCTINDMADREFDAKVARTSTRPLASGAVSLSRAGLFLALLLLAGLAVLLAFNRMTFLLALVAMPLVIFYPFMKRITWWPQAFLGLTFNWGVLLGWTALRGGLEPVVVVLYGGAVLWTLGYDTIYAHQDKHDDTLTGVKSTALRLGENTKSWLFVFYGGAMASIALAGWMAGLSPLFYLALAAAAAHLCWQTAQLDINDAANCLATFKSNMWTGLLVLAALFLGRIA